jgi:hypothetical protein
MFKSEIIVVFSEIHSKHIYSICIVGRIKNLFLLKLVVRNVSLRL